MMIEKWYVEVPYRFLLKHVTVTQEVSVSASCNSFCQNMEVHCCLSVNFCHKVKSSKITGIPSSSYGEKT